MMINVIFVDLSPFGGWGWEEVLIQNSNRSSNPNQSNAVNFPPKTLIYIIIIII